ncbi:hypothetical protein ADUPG1_004811, partial [Aduncisulcus paluster]
GTQDIPQNHHHSGGQLRVGGLCGKKHARQEVGRLDQSAERRIAVNKMYLAILVTKAALLIMEGLGKCTQQKPPKPHKS